jgi:hypothetical protein
MKMKKALHTFSENKSQLYGNAGAILYGLQDSEELIGTLHFIVTPYTFGKVSQETARSWSGRQVEHEEGRMSRQ